MAETVRQYAKRTGRKVTVTYGSKRAQERRKKSKSRSKRRPTKSYVDKFGVIRKEGGTGYSETAYSQAVKKGTKSQRTGLPSLKRTFEGRIGNKYYTNLSQTELEKGKLDFNTTAFEDKARTRTITGRASSRDIFRILGTREIDLSKSQNVRAIRGIVRADVAGRRRGFTGVVQGKVYRNLTQDEILKNQLKTDTSAFEIKDRTIARTNLIRAQQNLARGRGTTADILAVISRGQNRTDVARTAGFARELVEKDIRRKEIVKQVLKEREERADELARLNRLEKKYEAIAKRGQRSADARKKVVGFTKKIVPAVFDIATLGTRRLSPKKSQQYVESTMAELGALPYDLTIGLGRFIAGASEQIAFQIEAVGFSNYAKEVRRQFTSGDSPKVVLSSYDLRKPEGLANAIITFGFVGALAKGRVKAREVKNLPKTTTSKFKTKTILTDGKGNYALVSKGGKVITVPASRVNAIIKAQKLGKPLRVKKTEVARLTQKQLRGLITKRERKVLTQAQQKRFNTQARKEAGIIAKRTGLNRAETAQFRTLYTRFKNKPNLSNARSLKKFEAKVEVDQIVRIIDAKIAQRLKSPVKVKPKPKAKPRKKKPIPAKKKAKAKAKKFFEAEKKKADIQARKKGFKDAKEQLQYENAFRDYLTGSVKAKEILSKIEAKMRGRKSAVSKRKAKEFKALRERALTDALERLRKGEITIKNKAKLLARAKRKLNKKQQEALREIKQAETKRVETFADIIRRREIVKKYNQNTPKSQVTILKTIKKVKPKVKAKTISRAKVKARLKVLKGKTTTANVTSALALISRARVSFGRLSERVAGIKPDLAPSPFKAITGAINNNIKLIDNVISDIENIIGTDITPVQKQTLVLKQKQAKQVRQKYVQLLRKAIAKKGRPVTKVIIPKIPTLNWKTKKKLPKGYTYKVQPFIKSRGRVRNLGKPTTQNRGLKRATQFADNKLVRSVEVRIVGITKAKDIGGTYTKKFRSKISADPKVLQLVEKQKYAFDKTGEKTSARRARVSKRRVAKRKAPKRKTTRKRKK